MTAVFLYGEVDLPAIPQDLLIDTDQLPLEKFIKDIGYQRQFIKDGRTKNNSAYAKWTVNYQPLLDWVKQTVPAWPEQELLTIQKIIATDAGSDAIFPVHHDVRRMFALNYIISTGGDNVLTNWYRDRSQPIVRSLQKPIGVQSDSGPVDYSQVDLLATTQCEAGKWYLISTSVLHDVDHVDGERSAVTIPYFDVSIVDYFKQKNLFRTIKEIQDDPR